MSKRAGSRPPANQPGTPAGESRPETAAGQAAAGPTTAGQTARETGARPAQTAVRPATREAQPSWPQVIATTVRLWLGRRVRRGGEVLDRPQQRSRRWMGAFGLAIVVFAAGALTIALARGSQAGPASGSASRTRTTGVSRKPGPLKPGPLKLSTTALAAAARNRQQAAAWIAAQVSRAAIVSCDPVMCQALTAAGFPAGDLLTLGPSATDPMGSGIVVGTTVLRNQLGSRLPDVYAPAVLASFGTGATRVDVRVEAPDGAQAYLDSQRADLFARQQSGRQLLGSRDLHLTATARHAIATGQVDSRLLATLVALIGQRHAVYVDRFGDLGPGATPGVPMRMMRIAALVPRRSHARSSYLHSVLRFLASQQPPYRASASVLHLPGARTVIQIQFAAPSPLGLLGRHSLR